MYKVMIADDESVERKALQYIIKQSKLEIKEIEEASSGREAIEKAVVFKPDIILIDIKMPGINGIEAVKQIKKTCPDLRILFLTAFDYFNYAQEAVKVGAKGFIVKPATPQQIIQALKGIIVDLKEEKERKLQEQETETRLERIAGYLESELVSLLAIGNTDRHQAEEYFNLLGLDINKGITMVIEVNFSAGEVPVTSASQKSMMKKRYMEKFRIAFKNERIKTLMSAIGQFIYLFLFFDKKQERCIPDHIARLVAEITQRLYHQLNVPIRVGVGDIYNTIDDMYPSIAHARTALHWIKTPSGVSFYFQREDKKSEQQYPITKERALYQKMISGDEKEAHAICNELLDWIQANYSSTQEICRKVSEMMIVVCRALLMETNLSLGGSDAFIDNILKMESVEALKNYVFEMIKQTMNEMRNSWPDRSVLLVNKACEFVRQNYMKKITLEDASVHVGISQYYLSRVFKQVKKMNFVDYLSRIRIEKAKALLKEPGISITEVSSLIGYSDANYFSRVFKRTEGLSPTDYITEERGTRKS